MNITRRSILSTSAIIAATSPVTGCMLSRAASPEGVIDEANQILADEADKGWNLDNWNDQSLPAGVKNRAIVGNGWSWWDYPIEAEPKVSWSIDRRTIDYNHLNADVVKPSSAFSLDSNSLLWLAERNSFHLVEEQELLIFGLRGCTLQDGTFDSGWQSSLSLSTARPNHRDFACLIGVLEKATGLLRAFVGSTVPEAAYMSAQLEKNQGCNLLPTGLYAYRIGTHNLKAKKTKQIGALRLDGFLNPRTMTSDTDVVVLRTLDNLRYDMTDKFELWDRCRPYDNIHASIWAPEGDRGSGLVSPKSSVYSSAGCQVIRGAYELEAGRKFSKKPTHEWAEFRRSARLGTRRGEATETKYGELRQYMLLTGDEAFFAANALDKKKSGYQRIRFGSVGDKVSEFQTRIGITADGLFGPGTTISSLEFNKRNGSIASGHVVSL